MSDKFPSQTQDKFTVRFPDGMRDKIAEIAKKNNRSMNSEIICMLEREIMNEESLVNDMNEHPELYDNAYEIINDNAGIRLYVFSEEELKQFIDNELKKLSSSMIKSAKKHYIP